MFGIIIFSLVLVLIMASFRWFGMIYYRKHENEIAPKKNQVTHQPVVLTNSSNQNEDLTPVILAAVCASLQKKVQVRRIRFVRPDANTEGWGQTGRIQNMSNHYMSAPKSYRY